VAKTEIPVEGGPFSGEAYVGCGNYDARKVGITRGALNNPGCTEIFQIVKKIRTVRFSRGGKGVQTVVVSRKGRLAHCRDETPPV